MVRWIVSGIDLWAGLRGSLQEGLTETEDPLLEWTVLPAFTCSLGPRRPPLLSEPAALQETFRSSAPGLQIGTAEVASLMD